VVLIRLVRLTLAAVILLGVATAAAADKPRCYGAASRDPQKPCNNPSLRLKVTPTPTQALLKPNSICNRLHVEDLVRTCWWGARAKVSETTVALIGDSHASAWRAALSPVGKKRKWRGISNTFTSCAFSKVVSLTPKSRADACRKWNDQTVAWFERHPEVTTVFVVSATIPTPGFETQVKGFRDQWKRLPRTVKNIIVIRDNPRMQADTPPCIDDARQRKVPAGPACARKRSTAMPADPPSTAARRMNSKRIHVIDLSRYFCDATLCEPVIGGVLVYKDLTHITSEYGKTLAPYLEREVRRLDLGL
jgi:SGNH domain (fused to AT3 domains)